VSKKENKEQKDISKLLKKSPGDIVYDATRVALPAFPFIGGSLSALFQAIFPAPINRRRDKWLQRLGQTVEELLQRVEDLTPEALSENDRFISATLHASQIALRSHQEEKLLLLQNILTNIMLHLGDDFDLQSLHIRLIDELTPLHIRMLDFESDPDRFAKQYFSKKPRETSHGYGSLAELWNYIYPDCPANSGPAAIVAKDLYIRGLSRQERLSGAKKKISTKLGDEFLMYIKQPEFPQK
jgi:hypothetical protein